MNNGGMEYALIMVMKRKQKCERCGLWGVGYSVQSHIIDGGAYDFKILVCAYCARIAGRLRTLRVAKLFFTSNLFS